MLLHTGMYCMRKYLHIGVQSSSACIIVDVFTCTVYGYFRERCMLRILLHLSWYGPQCTQLQRQHNMHDSKL